MKITGYGVTLRRLTEDKIEMVRNWRNDPIIQQYMEFREYITSEMQKRWFERINNENNYYFIIVYEGKEIGLINIRDIDYEAKDGESGIFIYDVEYLNSDVPLRALFCMNDFVWETLKLERMHCHVLRDNKKAIIMNKALGYRLGNSQDDVENQLYILTRETANNPRIRKLKKICNKTIIS